VRRFALRKGAWIAAPIFFLATVFSSFASAETLGISSQTTTIETVSNASDIEIDDDFQVSGYSEEANLLVSLSITGSTQATMSLSVVTGLTREYGYNSWTNVSTLAFTGTQSDANTALASLTLSAGSTIGTATLNVSVQEKIAGANYFDGTGNFYEFVPGSITYMDARTAAGQRTLNGSSGYLVTITSEEEHNYVLTKIPDAYNIWIGLSDRAVEGTWVLDPKDGHPEQGTPVWSGLSNGSSIDGRYAKWCGGEPNDSGNEDAAVTKWNGGNCWNDLPATGYSGGIGGYVVEYEPTQGDNPIYTDSLEINIQAPYLNVVTNLTAVANADGSVDLDWDEPTASNVDIYAYGVLFYDLDEIGGTTSGGWGVWTNEGTFYSLSTGMFSGTTGYGPVRFGIKAGNQSCFSGEGVGPCVYGPEVTVDATVLDPASATTTTSSTTTITSTTTTTVPPSLGVYTATVADRDFYFQITETQTLTVRTYAWQFGIDSMLWLYNSSNQVIAQNDDYFGLDSYISINLQPGTYRLRAGVCCGDPDAWYGSSYTIEANLQSTVAPSTTTTTVPPTTTTTTTVPTTTTTTTSTTVPVTQPPATTAPEPEPEPEPEPVTTTTVYVPTVTTTTVPEEEEEESTTTTTVPEEEEESTPTTLPDDDEEPSTETTTVVPPQEEDEETTTTPPQEYDEEQSEEYPTEEPDQIEEIEEQASATIVIVQDSENIGEIIDAVTELLNDVSQEELAEVINLIIDSITEDKEAEDLTDEDKEKIAGVVQAIIQSGPIDADVAQELATNSAVLASISGEQAGSVFAAIETSDLTEEVKTQIIDAVQEAPVEVKQAFEEEINIYGEGFDEYIPLGSNIDVETRRSVIAVTTVLSTMTVAGAAGAASGGSTGPSGGTSRGGGGSGSPTPSSGTNDAARREEEEEEEGGGIEGPEDEEDIYLTRNSIFNYYTEGGIEMKKFNIFGLGKKVWEITAGLAFTLAGSFVMFVTLSGDTRKMAIIATVVALSVHYIHEVLKNDEE
jgi:hypothetical protein